MSFTPPTTVRGIKQVAKKIGPARGLTHKQAMDAIAHEIGYQNFRHAQNVLTAAVKQSRHEVYVTYRWRDRDLRTSGRETYRHELNRPIAELVTPYQMGAARDLAGFKLVAPDHIEQEITGHSQAYARREILKAVRTLDFIEYTGLKPSKGHKKGYRNGRLGDMFPGIDHAHIWFDPVAKQYIVVDEPYGPNERQADDRAAWARETGWEVLRSPWDGMYWPGGNTIMYLSTDATKGYSLKRTIDALRRMPSPPLDTPWEGRSGPLSEPFISPLSRPKV